MLRSNAAFNLDSQVGL